MKKLMFSALACVAFAFSGFASNEVVFEKEDNSNMIVENLFSFETSLFFNYPCQFSIAVVDKNGKLIDFVWVVGRTGGDECLKNLSDNVKRLNIAHPKHELKIDVIKM